jgi:DNA-binding HxlR family transcriptional regulator
MSMDGRIAARGGPRKSKKWTRQGRVRVRHLPAMKRYNQYCPIVRASEIVAERWMPVVMRNILLGCRTFTQIERGAPGIPKSLLTQRLKQLERFGIISRIANPAGRGWIYEPTQAGKEFWDVCEALGTWGGRWLEVAPEHLDPYVALWSMCNALDTERLPSSRTVVRLDFTNLKRNNRFWLLLENGSGEVCVKHPGFDEDLVVVADAEWFVKWHMGWIPWSRAVRAGRITISGPPALRRAFPTWNRLSHFAHVKPVAGVTP